LGSNGEPLEDHKRDDEPSEGSGSTDERMRRVTMDRFLLNYADEGEKEDDDIL
jgi:hypothetical protein